MRILVVDDEAKATAYLRKGLTESGFQVEVTNDGLDARHFIEQDSFDLVILDILRAKAQTPVLFLTALDSVEDRVRGLESGADDVLIAINPPGLPAAARDQRCCRPRRQLSQWRRQPASGHNSSDNSAEGPAESSLLPVNPVRAAISPKQHSGGTHRGIASHTAPTALYS